MGKIKREDLGIFEVTLRNRFSPEGIIPFLIGSFVYYTIPMYIMFDIVSLHGKDIFESTFEEVLACIGTGLYIIQLVSLLPFLSTKTAYRFQKLQTVVLLFSTFQLCTAHFYMLLIEGVFNFYSDTQTIIYVGLLLAGALICHILATIDVFREMKGGGFQYDKNSNTNYITTNIWFIAGVGGYVISLLILIFININLNIKTMIFYYIQTMLLYIFAFLSSKFVLLAYCRVKLPEINISWEQYAIEKAERVGKARRLAEQEKKRKERLKRREQNDREMLERWKRSNKKKLKK